MPNTRHYQITVPKADSISSDQALIELQDVLPISGVVTKGDGGTTWIFVVPTQIETLEKVEVLLTERGINATVRELASGSSSTKQYGNDTDDSGDSK